MSYECCSDTELRKKSRRQKAPNDGNWWKRARWQRMWQRMIKNNSQINYLTIMLQLPWENCKMLLVLPLKILKTLTILYLGRTMKERREIQLSWVGARNRDRGWKFWWGVTNWYSWESVSWATHGHYVTSRYLGQKRAGKATESWSCKMEKRDVSTPDAVFFCTESSQGTGAEASWRCPVKGAEV